MEFKIIVIGDTHVKSSSLDVVDNYISQIVKYVKEKDPDFVVLLGDTLDTHNIANEECFNKVFKLINEISELTFLYIIIGNHDYANQSQYLSTRHFYNPYKKWKNVKIIDDVFTESWNLKEHKDNPFNFLFVPYVPKGKFNEAIENIDLTDIDCILCHQEFRGAKMGNKISEDGDEWDECNPMIISGHIHDYQMINQNILYPGNSLQHSFAENSDKIILLVTFKYEDYDKNINIKKLHMTNAQQKKIVYLTYNEFLTFDFKESIKWLCKLKVTQDEYKVIKRHDNYKKNIGKIKIQTEFINEYIKPNEKRKCITFSENLAFLVEKENDDVKKLYQSLL